MGFVIIVLLLTIIVFIIFAASFSGVEVLQ